jgi:hypothetical protein
MLIRPLHPDTDRATVTAFFDSIADYIRMERDAPPDAEVIEEFFTDTPPGCDPTQSLRLGLFEHSTLIALAEMGFGYPESDNAYLAAKARARSCSRILKPKPARAVARRSISPFSTPTPVAAPSGNGRASPLPSPNAR